MRTFFTFIFLLVAFNSFAQTDYKIGLENKDGYTSIFMNKKISEAVGYSAAKYESRYGLIDSKTKEIILPLNYRMVYTSYQDGIYIIKDTTDKFGLYDANKQKIIAEPEYVNIDAFNEGLAVVRKNIPNTYDYVSGALDRNGNFVIPMGYDFLGTMSEGLMNFQKDKKYGFIDKQNKIVIPAMYSGMSQFRNGLAPANNPAGKFGYIDKDNVFVIAPQYEDADEFYEGYAKVYKTKGQYTHGGKTDDEAGLINSKGKIILEPVYNYVSLKKTGGFFVVGQKDKYGLADSTGKIVLPVTYKKIEEFYYGYAKVNDQGMYGLVNTKGKLVLPTNYNEIYIYSKDIISVKKDGKYAILDGEVKQIIAPDSAKRIVIDKGNIAYVFDDMVKLFDATGKLTKTIRQNEVDIYGVKFVGNVKKDSIDIPYFNTIAITNLQTNASTKITGTDFSDYNKDGIFVVKNTKFGFYDYNGKKLSQKSYENVANFNEGICVLVDNSYSSPYLADKTFTKIKDLSTIFYGPYSEGMAYTKGQYDGNLYYLDKNGNSVFGIKGSEGYPCKEGRIRVKNTAGKYLFVTKNGKILNEETYDYLEDFSEGLAIFKNDGKCGYIDTSGKVVIAAKFDEGASFTKGTAIVKSGKDYFLINKKGEQVTTAKYIEASMGVNGTFPVKKATGYGLIDNTGKQLAEFKYEQVLPMKDNMIWAKLKGKWGALNKTGTPVTAFDYDNVGDFNNEYALIEKNKKMGLINNAGKLILPVIYTNLSSVYKNTIVTYLPSGSKTVSIK